MDLDTDPATMTRLLIENEAEDLMDRAASGATTSVVILEIGPDGLVYTSLMRPEDSLLEMVGLMEQAKLEMIAAGVEPE